MALFSTDLEARTFLDRGPSVAAVRELGAGVGLAEMETIVDQVLRVVRDYYVHLPLKTSSLAIDPVQELTLLLDDIKYIQSEPDFFARLITSVKRLRDRHTTIKLPPPLSNGLAFLPFAVESYWDGARRLLVVSKLLAPLDEPSFVPGVEITHWNGMPIATYIERMAFENEGANPYARVAIALRSLTLRPLAFMRPPDEDWVVLTYVSNGRVRSFSLPWRVYFPPTASTVSSSQHETDSGDLTVKGLDRASLLVNSGWNDLYTTEQDAQDQGVYVSPDLFSSMPNPMANHFRFNLVRFGNKTYGYVRIFSFETADTAGYVQTFARFLQEAPPTGMIVDIRSNPGGNIPVGEALLQMFSTRPIQNQRLAFRVTTPVQKFVTSVPDLWLWHRSLGMRYETGQNFSQGYPLYDSGIPEGLHGIYPHPVVLVVDALSYSTSDFFAAGFQDNRLGLIIGADPVTGAGGANVWTHSFLRRMSEFGGRRDLVEMPSGIDFNFSLRRSVRTGVNVDLPVEGLGVAADVNYRMTRQDVLGQNEDLITFAGWVLGNSPRQ